MNTCTIVNTCRGKYVEETTPYIKNIMKYLHQTLGVSFSEFICDFIKDESGIWWMVILKNIKKWMANSFCNFFKHFIIKVNVKGFVFETPMPEEVNTKKITNHGDDMK